MLTQIPHLSRCAALARQTLYLYRVQDVRYFLFRVEPPLFALAKIGASSASALREVVCSPILDLGHPQDDLMGSRKQVHHYLGIKPASFLSAGSFFRFDHKR